LKISILITFSLFFLGCSPGLTKNKYDLKSCQKELLVANDYSTEESIDHIVVIKKEHKMYLYKKNKLQGIIPISLGKNAIDPKEKKGDNKTPEGTFFIHRKLCSSKYYRSLCISYPSIEDTRKAKRKGLDPGGDITIHAQPTWNSDGHGDGYTLSHDWTHGCIAITNNEMNRLWYGIHEGVPITIK